MLSIAVVIIFSQNGASTHRQPLTHSSAPTEYCCDTASRLEKESSRHRGTYMSPQGVQNEPHSVSSTPTPYTLHSQCGLPITTHTHPLPYTPAYTPSSKSHSRHVRTHEPRSHTCHVNKLLCHIPSQTHYTHCLFRMHPPHVTHYHTDTDRRTRAIQVGRLGDSTRSTFEAALGSATTHTPSTHTAHVHHR